MKVSSLTLTVLGRIYRKITHLCLSPSVKPGRWCPCRRPARVPQGGDPGDESWSFRIQAPFPQGKVLLPPRQVWMSWAFSLLRTQPFAFNIFANFPKNPTNRCYYSHFTGETLWRGCVTARSLCIAAVEQDCGWTDGECALGAEPRSSESWPTFFPAEARYLLSLSLAF